MASDHDLPETMLTPQQLADYLSIPVKSIYVWRQSGTGPRGFRVGKHVRYRLSDVNAWVAAQLDA